MIWHKIKRALVGGIHARNEPRNPEFENLQQRLDNVEGAMTKALEDIRKAEKTWNNVAHSAVEFCRGLHALYPADDGIRTIFKDTLDETTALQEEICGAESNISNASDASNNNNNSNNNTHQIEDVARIIRLIRGYLTEIKMLKREYPKVELARLDYGMYQRKLNKLDEKGICNSDDKKTKFLGLTQVAKQSYFAVLEGILLRMKSTFDKSPTMFRAVYVTYWLAQGRVHAAVSKHFNPAFVYATNHEKGLFQDIEPPTTIQE